VPKPMKGVTLVEGLAWILPQLFPCDVRRVGMIKAALKRKVSREQRGAKGENEGAEGEHIDEIGFSEEQSSGPSPSPGLHVTTR